ncbi:hypothetical protein EMGBS10_17460 [Opitutia bacterium]|nr:hypothetical protein EMGBS10_17460 [Opitutae bacterium]
MTSDAQLAALERLLDDPSPVVRQAVAAHVKAAGTAGILWLEKLAAKAELAPHAHSLLADLRTVEAAAQTFLTYLRAGPIDLEEACLLLERVATPSLPPSAYTAELDRLADRTRELIAEPLELRAKCRLLCRVLFGEEGYRGAQESSPRPPPPCCPRSSRPGAASPSRSA